MKNTILLILAATLVLPAAFMAGCKSSTAPPTMSPVAATFFFLIQPAGASAGVALRTQPLVEILDTYGEIDNGFTGAVTLGITKGSGTAKAVLSGAITLNAFDGVATFTDLSIDLLGSGYSLTASGSGLAPATSATFDVSASPAANDGS
jgi:hypothetical protein